MTPQQTAAVRHGAGPCEVIAGPGSGKTTVLVNRVRFLIGERRADPSQILVLTFTRAAAAVMRSRFASLSCHADSVTFSTFHALFIAILKDRVPGIRVIPDLQRRRFLQRALEDFFPYASLRPDPETLTAWMTARIAGGEAAEEPAFEEILSQYRRYLEDEGLVDLDEAAGMCTRILRREPELLRRWQARWTYFLVDEFQDINAPQYRMLLLLAGEACNVFAVGDDDQSIYGFRGSSPLFMQRFPEEHPGCRKYYLTVNYRSREEIVRASAAVIARNRERIPKELRADPGRAAAAGKAGAVQILGTPSERAQEEAVLRILRDVRPSGDGSAPAALIVRTHGQITRWAGLLRAHGIPCLAPEENNGRQERRRMEIAGDIAAYARCAARITEGAERKDLLRILNRPDRSLGREILPDPVCSAAQILSGCGGRRGTRGAVQAFLRDLRDLRQMRQSGDRAFLRYLFGPVGYRADLLGRYPSEQEEIRAWLDRLCEASGREGWHMTLRSLYSGMGETEQARQPADPLVELCTMHACKGREFDTVILPELNEGILPSRRAGREAEIEEERRLFYVAMTRARSRLAILYTAGSPGNPRMPSRFLEPLGERIRFSEDSRYAIMKCQAGERNTQK